MVWVLALVVHFWFCGVQQFWLVWFRCLKYVSAFLKCAYFCWEGHVWQVWIIRLSWFLVRPISMISQMMVYWFRGSRKNMKKDGNGHNQPLPWRNFSKHQAFQSIILSWSAHEHDPKMSKAKQKTYMPICSLQRYPIICRSPSSSNLLTTWACMDDSYMSIGDHWSRYVHDEYGIVQLQNRSSYSSLFQLKLLQP